MIKMSEYTIESQIILRHTAPSQIATFHTLSFLIFILRVILKNQQIEEALN